MFVSGRRGTQQACGWCDRYGRTCGCGRTRSLFENVRPMTGCPHGHAKRLLFSSPSDCTGPQIQRPRLGSNASTHVEATWYESLVHLESSPSASHGNSRWSLTGSAATCRACRRVEVSPIIPPPCVHRCLARWSGPFELNTTNSDCLSSLARVHLSI